MKHSKTSAVFATAFTMLFIELVSRRASACDVKAAGCWSSRAVCSDALNTFSFASGASPYPWFKLPKCLCPSGELLDWRGSGRCESWDTVGAVAVERTAPLYYTEQSGFTDPSDFISSRVVLPMLWMCSERTLSCQTYDSDTATVIESTEYDRIVGQKDVVSSVSIWKLAWKCDSSRFAVLSRFNVSTDPTVVPGMPWVASFCGTVNTTLALSLAPAQNPANGVFADFTRPCIVDAQCFPPTSVCYRGTTLSAIESKTVRFDPLTAIRGKCGCAPDYIFDPISGSCVDGLSPSNATAQTTFQKGVFLSNTMAFGAGNALIISEPNINITRVTRFKTDRHVFVYAARTTGLDLSSDAVIAPFDRTHTSYWWRCLGGSDSDALFRDDVTGDHCRGCAAVCGPRSNCSSSGTSNALSGRCGTCDAGWTGARCDRCVDGMAGAQCDLTVSACSNAHCGAAQGRGMCTSDKPGKCTCSSGWYGQSCELSMSDCRAAVCGGSQFVNASCVIDPETGAPQRVCRCNTPSQHGAYCNMTSSRCAQDRCFGGAGECVFGSLSDCTCPNWRLDQPDCSVARCMNNGTANNGNPLNTTSCSCMAPYIGDFCQTIQCGPYGRWNATSEMCICDTANTVAALAFNGSCTANTCGAFGQPSITFDRCICRRGWIDVPGVNPRCVYEVVNPPPSQGNQGGTGGDGGAITDGAPNVEGHASIVLLSIMGFFMLVGAIAIGRICVATEKKR